MKNLSKNVMMKSYTEVSIKYYSPYAASVVNQAVQILNKIFANSIKRSLEFRYQLFC